MLDLIPRPLQARYRFEEREHACAILAGDFVSEWKDLLDCLKAFTLRQSYIIKGGGGRSEIPQTLDNFLKARGWEKKRFDIQVMVDGQPYPTPTHEIDHFKNRIGVEVERNNKTEFYDRDLNNFRLLHQLHVLSVGVIITRVSELQATFNQLGIGKKYGPSTTHWNKLIPKVNGGGAGGCPLLLVGLGEACYDCHS
jgi:hypothetical protein